LEKVEMCLVLRGQIFWKFFCIAGFYGSQGLFWIFFLLSAFFNLDNFFPEKNRARRHARRVVKMGGLGKPGKMGKPGKI
jgi:hypothetical protein